MKIYWFVAGITVLILGCGDFTKTLHEEAKTDYLKKGDDISVKAQQVLMANVSSAIKNSGPAGAVEYCNERAIPLTDSIAENQSILLQRLSDKNRNPENAIRTETDRKAWKQLQDLMKDTTAIDKHLVLEDRDDIYYYKAIPLGMPTCLICHGQKEKDIALKTLDAIQSKYPNDPATGYFIGDLRGMWKIKFGSQNSAE